LVETTTAIRTLTRDQWDTLVQTFRDLSYQQCRSYCEEAARDTGATCELIGIYRDTELVGLANVRIRISPLLSFGIAYLSCGPLTARDDSFSGGVFGFCIEALKREYVEKRNLLLRLVPPLRGGQWFDAEIGLLENYGFRRSKRYEPYKTFILDLSPPLAEIRKNLDGKWRGHLSKAQRSDIEVTHSVALSDFDHLEPIFQTLIEHKRFTTRRDVKFFRRVQASEQSALQFVVHLAWHNDELIAGHIGSFVGDTAGAKVTAEQARNTLEPLCKEQPDIPDLEVELALADAVLGERDSALRERERAIMTLDPIGKTSDSDRLALEELLALIQTVLGENSRAISTLTQLLETPYGSLIYGPAPVTPALLRLDPIWDPLRADPAFQKLCEEKQP